MDTPDIDAQGRQMLRRAASPGVTHGGLGVRRKAIGSGSALAAEIQRRWTPADPAGWGSGPALHYAGQVAASGPAVPSAPAAGSAPRAQVVGQAASPAAQAAASPRQIPAGVQRKHLGTPVTERTARTTGTPTTPRTAAAPMPVVRRKAAETPAVQRQAAAPVAAAPASSPAPGEIVGPAIRRQSAGSPATPAAPAMPLHREAASGPLSREAGEGWGGGAPAASTVMMPAIVRRSAGRPLTPNLTGLRPGHAHPAPGRGEPTPASSSFPLSRSGGGKGRPEAGEGQGVRGPEASVPSLSASAAGLAMPLARSAAPVSDAAEGGGVIQRQEVGSGPVEASSPADSVSGEISPAASAFGAAAAGPDVEEVVDQVMRRLTRSLAVESERHGGRRWPWRS